MKQHAVVGTCCPTINPARGPGLRAYNSQVAKYIKKIHTVEMKFSGQ
jgi:hypothetical protein